MSTITIEEARANFSRIIDAALRGEEMMLLDVDIPRLVIMPINSPKRVSTDVYVNQLHEAQNMLSGISNTFIREKHDRTL
jgi:antitoxin (DNA-binding transcriptional repressor) of toxin-antitoxin stability system